MAGEDDVWRRIIDLINRVGEDIGSLQLNVSLNLYLWKRLVRVKEFLDTEWVRRARASQRITKPLEALHRAVMDANALVQECCSLQWIPAAIQQAENREAFFEVVKDLCWCTGVTLKALRDSGLDCRALRVEQAADELIRKKIDAAAIVDRKELRSRLDVFISNPRVDEANYPLRPEHLAIATHLKSWFWLEHPDIRTRLPWTFLHALWVGRKLPHWNLLRDAYSLYVSSSWPLPSYSIVGDRTNFEEKLGGGAGGSVYKCQWQGQVFAEKNLTSNELRDVFQQEAAVMRDIRHPNVVKLIAQDDARCKLMLELMNGSLHDLINKRAPFPLAVIVDILLQISKAFLFLHKKRVAHRDIKPGNILYNFIPGSEPESFDIQIKVADFGLAKVKLLSQMAMTVNLGTTPYTPPELLNRDPNYVQRREKVNVKHSLVSADVYCFGVTCFVVAVGNTFPYGNLPPPGLADLVKEGLRPLIPDGVRDELAYLMRICWSEDPLKRPPFTYIYKFLLDFKASLLTDPESAFQYEEWNADDASRWSARCSNIMNGMARASNIVWTLLSVALVWALCSVKLLFTGRFKSLEEITERDVRSRHVPYEQVNQVEITMTPTSALDESAFKTGAYFLTQLAPHPNLPTLVGYSVHQNNFYLLHKADSVRGVHSLHDIMDLSGTGDWQIRYTLTWPERYNVALGVGQALAFLHQQRVPIVHGNLSSKSIMLQRECNYAPKLFNFYTSCGLQGPSTLHPNDTRGWLPNDVRADNTAFAVDVYSYGVLLLVLVADKNVYTTSTIGPARGQQVHIVDEAIENFKYDLRGLESDLIGSDPDVVFRVLRLALHCVQQNPRRRPSMTAALDMLTGKEELNDNRLVT